MMILYLLAKVRSKERFLSSGQSTALFSPAAPSEMGRPKGSKNTGTPHPEERDRKKRSQTVARLKQKLEKCITQLEQDHGYQVCFTMRAAGAPAFEVEHMPASLTPVARATIGVLLKPSAP
jgi:hypothetical protein